MNHKQWLIVVITFVLSLIVSTFVTSAFLGIMGIDPYHGVGLVALIIVASLCGLLASVMQSRYEKENKEKYDGDGQ